LAEACLQQAQEELEDRVHERTADLAQANHRLQAEIAERAHVEATLRQREIQLQHLTAIGRIMSASLDIQEVYQTFSGSFSLEQSGLRSHLVHPLIMHDRVIGLLYLGAVQAHAYDERTRQLAESVSNQIAGAIANAQHYAERQRLEMQLQQAHKMEAIGTLAGGIAHDFNNLLAVIIGHTELLSLDLATDTEPASYVQEILTACRRAKALVQQILTFSRQRDLKRQPVSLHHVVRETLQLLRASLPATIAFQCHIDPQSGAVMAEPTQMHQDLMNLCANANTPCANTVACWKFV
jgi:C4-dicarboxylate-specific signal transduction histidine kinase